MSVDGGKHDLSSRRGEEVPQKEVKVTRREYRISGGGGGEEKEKRGRQKLIETGGDSTPQQNQRNTSRMKAVFGPISTGSKKNANRV